MASAESQRDLKSLARHSAIYSVAPILQKALNLLLIGVYTEKLNEAQWGVSQLADLLIVATTQLAGVNLFSGMVRFYFDHEDERDRAAVVSSATIFLMAVSGALVAVGVLLREPLAQTLFVVDDPKLASDDLTLCLVVALTLIPLGLTTEAGFRYLQIHRRSSLISTLRVIKAAAEMLLRIWMIVFLELGVLGFLLPIFIGELVTSSLLTGWVLVQVRLRFVWRVLRPMLIYTLPLIPVGFCQMGLHQFDRLLLRHLGPEDIAMTWTGIYGLGYQVGFLVQYVVVGSFMQIWQPYIFDVKDPEEQRQQLAHFSTYAFLLIATGSLGLITFGRELVFGLSGQEGFTEAYRVVPWITSGYLFFGLNGLSQVPLFIAKRTVPMLWVNIAALVINVALNFFLIPRLGFVGAAIATFATFACLAGMGLTLSMRLTGTRFELRRMGAIAVATLGTAALVLLIDRAVADEATLLTIFTPAKAGLLAFVLAGLWFLVLRRDERDELWAWVRAKLKRGQA